MKIVVLDGYHINPGDLSWSALEDLGDVDIHESTSPEEIIARAQGATILLTNKVLVTKEVMDHLPELKCICVMATGYNNVDIGAAKNKGIVVCNVAGYSTKSVAQHVFAGIFGYLNRILEYAEESRQGVWTSKNDWTYSKGTIVNVAGKTLGILGFGQIGQEVGKIGLAFGMKVIAYHKHPERDRMEGVTFVELDELFKTSDFLSLHVPLNPSTKHIINIETLSLMKGDAVLINTGRGPLVDESALASCLERGGIGAALLDVMEHEPPMYENPLIPLKNCYITPHVAWAGLQARAKLIEILVENVSGFINGDIQNRIV